MRAELLVALAPLPELEYKDSMPAGRATIGCSWDLAQPSGVWVVEFEDVRNCEFGGKFRSRLVETLGRAHSPSQIDRR